MVRSINTHAQKRRRLPHHAVIEREDPYRAADAAELEAACVRLAGNSEWYSWMRRGPEGYVRVIGFETAERAAAMQEWIEESGITKRALPYFARPNEVIEVERAASIAWGFNTGAVRRVVQAYRRKMFEVGEGEPAKYQASHAVSQYRPPTETMTVAMHIVDWAKQEHPEWFYRRRKVIEAEPSEANTSTIVRNDEAR